MAVSTLVAETASEAAPPPQPVLSQAQRAFLDANGYLSLQRITSEADVAFIRGELESLFRRRAGYGEGALFDFAGEDTDETRIALPQLLGPHKFCPRLLETEFHRNALAVARQVLGPAARMTFDHAIMKPPETGGATPWHQDAAFGDPKLDYPEISFWLALQPVDEINGCMRFVPGSHREEILPHAPFGGDTKVHALDCAAAIDETRAVSCPLPAGGCTLHTTKTVHGAGPNHSTGARWAYVVVIGTDPTPAAVARAYPWQEHRMTARMKRRRNWLLRGGIVVAVWRKVRQRLVR